MVTIRYKIEFFSNWHCGSGLAAGADVDALVIKNSQGLPYVPGRTVKGLLREAAESLFSETDKLSLLFGVSGDMEKHQTGCLFLSNASLPENESQFILANNLSSHLFQTFASTAIDEKTGLADDHSLRKIETVIPCTLEGEIMNVPDGKVNPLKDAMAFIKRMGTGRNRGLGRCQVSIIEINNQGKEVAK